MKMYLAGKTILSGFKPGPQTKLFDGSTSFELLPYFSRMNKMSNFIDVLAHSFILVTSLKETLFNKAHASHSECKHEICEEAEKTCQLSLPLVPLVFPWKVVEFSCCCKQWRISEHFQISLLLRAWERVKRVNYDKINKSKENNVLPLLPVARA